MEILLAIVVASAVIFFGALISMGNERQRRAIDSLREEIVRWSEQDLLIKREKLSLVVQVPDPLNWFGRLASKVAGMNLNLYQAELHENINVLSFLVENTSERVLFTTSSPADIRRLNAKEKRDQLHDVTVNPLHSLPRNVMIRRISLGNGGFMFDLQFPLAWKALTGKEPEQGKEVWLYLFPDSRS
ncbi:MAG TPA: hypothetical protein PLU80_23715 [Acidobacteriota bacterium]|nr:hypothetical protein [Acidobacteriota bacterium]